MNHAALSTGAHTIDIDGVPLRYHVAGTGPVCVAHSGGPGIRWESLRMPDLERYRTLVYPEPVGTGESGRLPSYPLAEYVRFLHGLVEHLDVPRVALLGHSHGGFVVQRYALDHPDRVAGLVLYSTSPVTGMEFWQDAVANFQRFGERNADQPEITAILAGFPPPPNLDDDTFTATLRLILPAYFADYWGREREFGPLRAAIRGWAAPQVAGDPAPFDVRGELSGITAPTLIVTGAHDFICGPRWSDLLHSGITAARLLVLPDSGHFGHLEQSDEFTAAVVALPTYDATDRVS